MTEKQCVLTGCYAHLIIAIIALVIALVTFSYGICVASNLAFFTVGWSGGMAFTLYRKFP